MAHNQPETHSSPATADECVAALCKSIEELVCKKQTLTAEQLETWRKNHAKEAYRTRTHVLESHLGHKIELTYVPKFLAYCYKTGTPTLKQSVTNIATAITQLKLTGLLHEEKFKTSIREIVFGPTATAQPTPLPQRTS